MMALYLGVHKPICQACWDANIERQIQNYMIDFKNNVVKQHDEFMLCIVRIMIIYYILIIEIFGIVVIYNGIKAGSSELETGL